MADDAVYCQHCATNRQNPATAPLYIVDRMTGLFNDAFTDALVEHETSRAVRYKRPLTILVGVIDHEDLIREDIGPRMTADLHRQVADVLQSAVRDIDTVGWLGDRYCIVLPETDASGSLVAAEKIMHAIAATQFTAGGSWGRLTMSFGAATVNPDRMGRQDLVGLATDALRAGREEGSTGRVHVYHTDL
jgi:diguanylate cyclase (GGDEF)-like protein